jgi:glycerol-3-phosphate dehydrogenase (NAD(P)+)
MNIRILGAGAWGTAIALQAARAPQQAQVSLCTHRDEHARAMQSTSINQQYLPEVLIPKSINIFTVRTISSAVSMILQDLTIVATPLSALREQLTFLNASACGPVLLLSKGIEQGTQKLPHQIAAEFTQLRCASLSGPSFAQEVAAGLPCALSIAGDAMAINTAQKALHHSAMRLYASDDIMGIELGGAMKNVIAIAAGISDGMQLGTNARAALITRGLAEITRLGVAMGAKADTFMGLAGLGDLVLTCTGPLSRNRRVGLELASGRPLPEIITQLGHVAEGVHAARAALMLAQQHQVPVPIAQAVVQVLEGELTPQGAITALLSRPARNE